MLPMTIYKDKITYIFFKNLLLKNKIREGYIPLSYPLKDNSPLENEVVNGKILVTLGRTYGNEIAYTNMHSQDFCDNLYLTNYFAVILF